jgi:hypothetical protein
MTALIARIWRRHFIKRAIPYGQHAIIILKVLLIILALINDTEYHSDFLVPFRHGLQKSPPWK